MIYYPGNPSLSPGTPKPIQGPSSRHGNLPRFLSVQEKSGTSKKHLPQEQTMRSIPRTDVPDRSHLPTKETTCSVLKPHTKAVAGKESQRLSYSSTSVLIKRKMWSYNGNYPTQLRKFPCLLFELVKLHCNMIVNKGQYSS